MRVIARQEGLLSFEVPIKTVSELNIRQHGAARHRRVSDQRGQLRLCAYALGIARSEKGTKRFYPRVELPVEVTLIRVAPRGLDRDDNLPASMKAIRDEIAVLLDLPVLNVTRSGAIIAKDDDPRVTWRYAQERGKPRSYSVRVIIRRPDDGPRAT